MTPQGPYHNPAGFSTGNWYLVADLLNGEKTYRIVRDGQQRGDGLLFINKRDAVAWLRENGFVNSSESRLEWERATAEAVAELQARAEAEAAAQRHAETMIAEEGEYPW